MQPCTSLLRSLIRLRRTEQGGRSERVQGFVAMGEIVRKHASTGAWVGGMVGLFTSAAFIWVPVIGPLVVLGALVSTVVGALEGGVAGELLGAIWGRYMGSDHVLRYQEALHLGKLVVSVHGLPHELASARRVLDETGGQDLRIYSAS